MSDPVRDQYEAYPYPSRDPARERDGLIAGSPSNLAELNHYVFAGWRDFLQPFRVLVAGGGTGDAAIMLAQQLADTGGPGHVIYLDLSRSARAIAEARARERGLQNIEFHTGSLLNLSELNLGRFDYIDCCGVLHHLEDPAAGLRALAAALDDGGGLGLMLYAPYGRSGVYEAQAMLRTLGAGLGLPARVDLAHRLLAELPAGNRLRRNPFVGDHKKSDAELVDLLLHPRDRAFSVPQLAALAEAGDMRLVALLEPALYEPKTYLKDKKLLQRLEGLDWLARAAFAEDLAGHIKHHVAYLVKRARAGDTVAQPKWPDAVPVLRTLEGPALAKAIARELTLKVTLSGLRLEFDLPRLAPAILARIDGRANLEQIYAALRDEKAGVTRAAFDAEFARLYEVLNGLNHLLIRYPA